MFQRRSIAEQKPDHDFQRIDDCKKKTENPPKPYFKSPPVVCYVVDLPKAFHMALRRHAMAIVLVLIISLK